MSNPRADMVDLVQSIKAATGGHPEPFRLWAGRGWGHSKAVRWASEELAKRGHTVAIVGPRGARVLKPDGQGGFTETLSKP